VSHVPDVNRREPDYDRLLNLKALSGWTLARQQEHAEDRAAYERALASFQSHLRSQHVEGDGRGSAARRARKVEKHLKALVKASRKAEEAAEGLRNSYATHVAQVAGLPAQREAKALKGAGRRQALGELTAKSLHKTAATAVGPTDSAAPAEAVPPAGAPARGINQLWKGQSA